MNEFNYLQINYLVSYFDNKILIFIILKMDVKIMHQTKEFN